SFGAVSGCLDGDLSSGGCRLGGVQIFDLNTGAKLADYSGQVASVRAILFLGNGRLITAADDNTVWAWDFATSAPTPLALTTQAITDVALSPDGNTIAISHCGAFGDSNGVRVCTDARVSLYDSASLAFKSDVVGPRDMIMSVAFSPSGTILALASLDNTVTLYQITDSKLLETYVGYIYGATSVAFSPDGSLLATGDNGGIMTLLRVAVQ
ncbi:MAG: PD40 domain-containing protein, partial [Anaerolineae bacterium]|nr:PD40 domain-containing protein [Anaerolineae bacterium]